MTKNEHFNSVRSTAIRGMLTDTVAGKRPGVDTTLKRRPRAMIIALATAATVVLVGGIGLAVSDRSGSGDPGQPAQVAGPSHATSAPVQPTPTGTLGPTPTLPSEQSSPTPLLPANESTPTPVPPPSLSSAPSPTATAAPALDSWLITPTSVGPITLRTAPIQTLLDAGFKPDVANECVALYNYKTYPDATPEGGASSEAGYDITVGIVPGSRGVRYVLVAGYFGSEPLSTRMTSPSTSTGIGIGSTADELKAAYPGLTLIKDTWQPESGGYREYVTGPVDGNYLHFDTTGGTGSDERVTSIRLNDVADIDQAVC